MLAGSFALAAALGDHDLLLRVDPRMFKDERSVRKPTAPPMRGARSMARVLPWFAQGATRRGARIRIM